MEKQYLKRLGYGFSALVLGLSAVNFFPAINAYATGGDTEPAIVSVSEPSVTVTSPDSAEVDYTISEDPFVIEGEYQGEDLIITVDNEPIDATQIEMLDGEFTAEIEFEEAGTYTVKVMALEGDNVAAWEITVTVEEGEIGTIDPGAWITNDFAKTVNVGETVELELSGMITSAEKMVEYDSVPATEEDLTITQSEPGKVAITALKGGVYTIAANSFKMVEGVLTMETTYVWLTAIDAGTDAAKTITNVMNAQNESESAVREFIDKFNKEHPDATEEEFEAAWERAYQESGAEANALKFYNALGDSVMAIEEAVDTGKTITTDVTADELAEADIDDTVKDAILSQLDVTYSNVKFYNVDVNVYADGEKIGTLKELTNDETVVISGFSGPAAGFKRVFQVVRYHIYTSGFDETTGEPIEEVEVTVIDDVEFDEATGTISFASDKFSTYAVAYKDVLAASVNTGEFTSEGASASATVSTSVIAAIAAIALFGAFKFAKSKRS